MRVLQTTRIKTVVKKTHKNQKRDLGKAVREIMANPAACEMKVGDLTGVQVYRFKMADQLTLTLLGLGAHENFYRDLKR
ncbi:hypothetical protein QQ73_21300 [Candidatus Endoriftia persephone str. Guaymas]|jgi:hypothetical protein|uniref:Uncharacterized protein n=2 Tax=Gammaproteobacteria TaxID=1236 RepID=G2DCX3_9GAMM|nr:type II toxin-antitoxin system RelE/ParE family toxin [Candidatus Endoriftia persephone]EGV51559.1 hypothetical protein Rifp1Sym_bf00320 [endosymbiont of Riftia pachyptila (vent Ph05)]MBA1333464.1 hypothetical protein [Candidatus Endoriftia persephone str. Guaymas]USF88686.1 type II toxin-antitoxin system RelE/ParE family toxin [Candidatus Endoriftia persephone]